MRKRHQALLCTALKMRRLEQEPASQPAGQFTSFQPPHLLTKLAAGLHTLRLVHCCLLVLHHLVLLPPLAHHQNRDCSQAGQAGRQVIW